MSLMTGHTVTRIWKRKKKKKKHISCHVPEKPKLTFHQTDKILQIHASIVCTIQGETAVDLLTLTLSWGQWVMLTVSILSPDPSQLPGPLEWCSSALEQTRSDSYQTKHHEEEILSSFFMPPAMFQAVWSSLPKRGPSKKKKKRQNARLIVWKVSVWEICLSYDLWMYSLLGFRELKLKNIK